MQRASKYEPCPFKRVDDDRETRSIGLHDRKNERYDEAEGCGEGVQLANAAATKSRLARLIGGRKKLPRPRPGISLQGNLMCQPRIPREDEV
ncbi:hypothetical protein WN51_10901 [Melipona quadrifasciata]|uniref:Uncharacterized protein n=1 Tax=Melipona quadrifasciata TaxID=166423 RepID=A0A0M9A4W6_9HYME|nr:hypothetical protein WN51_10901 [Melipona quadrifasciata]